MNEFEEIDRIRDASGVAAVITRRLRPAGDLIVTFRFVKEFQRTINGPVEDTAFFNSRHLAAFPSLLSRVEERIQQEMDSHWAKRRA